MERHTAEHKLIHFKESIKGFDGKWLLKWDKKLYKSLPK